MCYYKSLCESERVMNCPDDHGAFVLPDAGFFLFTGFKLILHLIKLRSVTLSPFI